jgi:hypothetical protein
MSDAVLPTGESLELDFNGHTVRALMIKGVPFMALPDILDACGYNDKAGHRVHSESFPSFGKHVGIEEPDQEIPGEPCETVFLSPTGIFYWSVQMDPARTDKFTAWARREAHRLCPDAARDDHGVYLALVPGEDGWTHIPPGPPSRYSGWKREWQDLKDAHLIAWIRATEANSQIKVRLWMEATGRAV